MANVDRLSQKIGMYVAKLIVNYTTLYNLLSTSEFFYPRDAIPVQNFKYFDILAPVPTGYTDCMYGQREN